MEAELPEAGFAVEDRRAIKNLLKMAVSVQVKVAPDSKRLQFLLEGCEALDGKNELVLKC